VFCSFLTMGDRVRSKRWVFTWNNYTDATIVALSALECVYLVYGRETSPTTGTPHLQGFVIFRNARHRTAIVAELGGGHWERALGTSAQAAEYCKKDGDYVERGTFPDSAGKRTDLEGIVSWIDEFIRDNGRAPSEREIAAEQPIALLKRLDVGKLARLRAPSPVLRDGDLLDWQESLRLELEEEANDREIMFYVDEDGGKGKTYFQQWMVSKYPDRVQCLGVGKRDDMTFAVDSDKTVFFVNVPRGAMEFLQFTVLEQLKDRMVFSTKYQSVMKVLPKVPHVVVFTNEMPDMSKMSQDRYVIRMM